jgi:hypothetical protein
MNRTNKSSLLQELSEVEQESLTGGLSTELGLDNFFFQKTDIRTFGSSDVNISGNGSSGSSSQRTGYSFSQITIGFNSLFRSFGGRRSRGRGGVSRNFLSFLAALF